METAKVNLIVNAAIQKLPYCMKAVSERGASGRVVTPEWLIASMKVYNSILVAIDEVKLKKP
ncbi:hypothetical protein H6G96_29825 [Nostoc sp. FACHB-892]|uniref:hypothetical protein n=1 Tax=Nostoc sp. FACHB-892 TaxID=2692843 RepID=UPI0016847EDF|nr:hypothetical protein [Nostoc sp. FACHB-892]MBD2730402.1 hypothetical protein [Nostoc sp. FACHB-892]